MLRDPSQFAGVRTRRILRFETITKKRQIVILNLTYVGSGEKENYVFDVSMLRPWLRQGFLYDARDIRVFLRAHPVYRYIDFHLKTCGNIRYVFVPNSYLLFLLNHPRTLAS